MEMLYLDTSPSKVRTSDSNLEEDSRKVQSNLTCIHKISVRDLWNLRTIWSLGFAPQSGLSSKQISLAILFSISHGPLSCTPGSSDEAFISCRCFATCGSFIV